MPPAAATGGPGTGWLANLLTRAGVTAGTARSVSSLVVRPVEILLVILAGVAVAYLGSRAIRRGLTRVSHRAAARSGAERARPRVATLVALAGNVWRFVVAVVVISIILGIIGINLTPLLASATVIGATIGFGAQSLVRDYLSGVLITMEDQYGIGDTITVADATGVVEDVSLRTTRIRSADGSVWFVPNGEIRRVANSSRGWAKAVVDLVLPRLDGPALERARRAVDGAAREVAAGARFAATCTEPPELVGIVAADADTCTLRLALRTVPSLRIPLERALREAAVSALAAAESPDGTAGGTGAGGAAGDAPSVGGGQ